MEGLTKRGFAEFVDNVDTRARKKIHFILLLDYGARCWGGAPPFPSTISTKSAWSTRAANFLGDAPSRTQQQPLGAKEQMAFSIQALSEAANFDEEKLERAI